MRTFKLYLLLAAVLTALCFTLFIIVSAVSSIGQDYDLYKSLSPDNMSQFKKTNFITSYTYLTGDYSFAMSLGYEKSTIESLVNQQYGSQSNTSSYGDARDIVMEYMKAISEIGLTTYGHSKTTPNAITINGKTIPAGTTLRLDCSGTASVFRYLLGKSSSLSITDSNGFADMGQSSSGIKIGDLDVGDCICFGTSERTNGNSGHVEIVVAKDSENVYLAGTGGSTPITKQTQQGYSHVVPIDTLVTNIHHPNGTYLHVVY